MARGTKYYLETRASPEFGCWRSQVEKWGHFFSERQKRLSLATKRKLGGSDHSAGNELIVKDNTEKRHARAALTCRMTNHKTIKNLKHLPSQRLQQQGRYPLSRFCHQIPRMATQNQHTIWRRGRLFWQLQSSLWSNLSPWHHSLCTSFLQTKSPVNLSDGIKHVQL